MFHNFPFPIGFLGSVHTASSRKATPRCFAQSRVPCRFQSTPSSRRATAHIAVPAAGLLISIHALLTEGDGGRHRSSKIIARIGTRTWYHEGGEVDSLPSFFVIPLGQRGPNPPWQPGKDRHPCPCGPAAGHWLPTPEGRVRPPSWAPMGFPIPEYTGYQNNLR